MNPDRRKHAFVLRALHMAGARLLNQDALVAHMQVAFRDDASVTRAEAVGIIKQCEEAGWINGVTTPLIGVQWGLTPMGRHQILQMLC